MAIARVLDRVAVLVAAGVPPPRAWELVTDATDPAAERPEGQSGRSHHRTDPRHADADRRRAGAEPRRGGVDLCGGGAGRPRPMGRGRADDRRRSWDASTARDVEGVLAVAGRTGAPVAPTLRALAASLRDTEQTARSVRVAVAGPRASTRVVLALPAFGVLLGRAWGVDSVGVLLGGPVGWACLVTAVVLVAVAHRWTRQLVAAAAATEPVPGLLLDVWAVALSGGGAWSGAGGSVDAVFPGRTWPTADRARLAETLALAERAGVPAAGLLRTSALDRRADAAAEGLARTERLGVRLVLPLGVCVLPAFVLVGVVPVVLGILSSTSAAFG
ncbi:type II secretion system F family protein [Curtobacterium sp. MCBD17_032]|uniref:type II secretion system F family protein n=1 Tax=Curtobacterium sp. MCBD17_032 TaxID=2175659 RepID=UPI000DA98E9D|nr:pilus assembly protein TadB [Curtobacterium sp. MCBD17_032]PZE85038.1 pilus assembly protein TadB [Curtobacterium sp. MCBD17_032]